MLYTIDILKHVTATVVSHLYRRMVKRVTLYTLHRRVFGREQIT